MCLCCDYWQAWVGHPYYDVIDNSTDFEHKVNRMISVSYIAYMSSILFITLVQLSLFGAPVLWWAYKFQQLWDHFWTDWPCGQMQAMTYINWVLPGVRTGGWFVGSLSSTTDTVDNWLNNESLSWALAKWNELEVLVCVMVCTMHLTLVLKQLPSM